MRRNVCGKCACTPVGTLFVQRFLFERVGTCMPVSVLPILLYLWNTSAVTWSWTNEIVTLWMGNKSSHIILFEEKINSTPKHKNTDPPLHPPHSVSTTVVQYMKPQGVCACVFCYFLSGIVIHNCMHDSLISVRLSPLSDGTLLNNEAVC